MFNHAKLIGLVCALVLGLMTSRTAMSQPSENLQLDALVRELLETNPDIRAANLRYQAALTRPSQEGALPDPRLNFGWMSAGTILPGGKLGEDPNANIAFQLSQEFPFPGKRGLRTDIAVKEAESSQQNVSVVARERIAALKTAYHELVFNSQSLELLKENQETLSQLGKVAEARYSVGKAMQQDLIKARTEVSILQNRILVLQQQKQSLVAEINAILNRPATTPLGTPEHIALPTLEAFETLLDRAKTNAPMLLAEQAMIQSRELDLKLAKKEYYPDFEVMTGYYYQGEMEDMWEVKAEISIPVFLGRKQRKQLQESSLELERARKTYRSAEQTIQYRLRDAYVKAETSRNLVQLYESQIVPQSKLALESSLASYETGGVEFLTVLSNFTTILEYRMNFYEQQAEYLKAIAILEELSGPSTGAVPVPNSPQEVKK